MILIISTVRSLYILLLIINLINIMKYLITFAILFLTTFAKAPQTTNAGMILSLTSEFFSEYKNVVL